jgi:hypothetical protein
VGDRGLGDEAEDHLGILCGQVSIHSFVYHLVSILLRLSSSFVIANHFWALEGSFLAVFMYID